MFIFENPNILWFLLLLLPFTALFYYNLYRKKKSLARLGAEAALLKQVPDYSKGKPHLKFFMLMMIYALLVVALANPQLGTSVKKVERKGIDVMIALDISNSMNSNDIQPSRLMRAKQAVIRILDKMESDRIGLVVFAGDAVLQLPLTTDYSAAKLFIGNVQTSDLSRQGTAIGKAIRLCADNFDPKYEKDKNKAIIVISDGENHEDDAVGEAAAAARKGIVVSTVGMGSPQGAPIPEYRNGKIVSYKKDRNGQVVITRMNRSMMQDIAKAGDGFFVEANNISSGVEQVFDKLSRLDKVTFESQNISDYETRYGYFVALALLLLVLEIFLFEKRNKVLNRARLFGSKTGRTAVLTLFLCTAGTLAPLHAQRAIPTHKGNRLYLDSSFQNAEIAYLKALANDSTYYKAHYNLGNTQYRQGDFEGAAAQYHNTLQNPFLTKDERADAYHNMGNAYMQSQDYQKAVDAYVEALKNKPGRNDSRYNLAYAQKMLQQQQQQQNQQNKNDKNQDKNNQDKNNQDKNQHQQNQQDKDKDKQQQQQQNSDNQPRQSPQQQQRQKQKEQDAERILRALENQEKNTLEKIKKEENRGKGSPVEKDW